MRQPMDLRRHTIVPAADLDWEAGGAGSYPVIALLRTTIGCSAKFQ